MHSDTLFDPPEPNETAAQAPSPVSHPESKAERIAREREILENRLAGGELDDTRTRVAYVLNQYPQCRNSDVELTIQFWKLFDSDDVGVNSITYEALFTITPMISIIRARQTIQNTFGLFVSDETINEFRNEREQRFRRRQRAAKATVPVVQIYADESGKTDNNDVVGSLWVNDVDEQSLKLFKTLNEWRKKIDFTSELHFSHITPPRKEAYIDFVRQAMTAVEYIGFKVILLRRSDVRQRPTEEAIFGLYYRLIVEGIEHEVGKGRFTLPRIIVLRKDEDEGADKLHLLSLRDKLSVECPKQFDNQVEIAASAMKSGSNVLMQLADVVTGSVNRIVNRETGAPRNQKDEVAECVLRLLGLDWRDIGNDGARGDFITVVRL